MKAVEIIRKVISSYKNTGISSDVMVNELLKLVDDSILEMEKKQQSYSEEDMLRFAQKYAVNTLDKSHIKEFKKK